ncbi:AsmA family protein [Marinobacter sp. X15-166B]|uniref:AsmA family protein n=1 Tax=Marinobacter sp. X15-166B TaxID=1897620 RepID=UPI00085C76BC|nr:AsmA family protein [Marinobacter sp. X15-166B]OEY65559.1 cell envelope biogenesis protein AsmA [Marinobacter sp. X15-166B]
MKAVRYLLIAIVGLVLLAVAAVVVALAVLDPNDYKPQIEQVVAKHTNLVLTLDGDLSWSFIPLGLELNDVEATLDDARLVKVDQLIAEVNLWSLITMAPQVATFVVDGLDVRLTVDKAGKGNWTRIMREPAEEAASEAPATADTEQPATEDRQDPLSFNIESVQISNAQVHYDDSSTGQSVTLDKVSISASDITLGADFPLQIGFHFATTQPEFRVDGDISARLAANETLDEFALTDLDGRFDMTGEPFGGQTAQASISGSARANLSSETATLTDFNASLADLQLTANLEVAGFGDQPALTGNLNIASFSLKKLLADLGMPAIETDDPNVLEQIAVSTDIGGPAGTVALTNLSITVDDTRFTGDARYGLGNGAIGLTLQGDALNADRYLPPAGEADEAAPPEAKEAATSPGTTTDPAPASETDLLPLETLRTLVLDIDLGLRNLQVSNLTINDLKALIRANAGLIQVEEFSGKLYDGGFDTNLTLDARTDSPQWHIGARMSDVQTQPLLTDLADLDMLAGGANLQADIQSAGNRISVLRNNASGEMAFNLDKGEFTRMNLTRMACQGIALVNTESLGDDNWGPSTPFNDMKGTFRIDGNTLTNTDLVAALIGMRLEGDGTVDLAASTLDYKAGLHIVGEIHRDPACRVSEGVQNLIIPIECRGNFAEDPAGLCSFDGSRFRDILKDVARNRAKAKAEEEIDRAKAKASEKLTEKLGEKLGGEDGDKVKDALKGLFR